MGWKVGNSSVSTRVGWVFLAERPFQRGNFEEIPQKTNLDLADLIWKAFSY